MPPASDPSAGQDQPIAPVVKPDTSQPVKVERPAPFQTEVSKRGDQQTTEKR